MVKTKAADSSTTNNDKKIFDVAHPGTSTPSATSRPVIVTNRPILRDPMVVEKSDDKPPTEEATATSSVTRIKISPLSETEKTEDPETEATGVATTPPTPPAAEAESVPPAETPETEAEPAEESLKSAETKPATEGSAAEPAAESSTEDVTLKKQQTDAQAVAEAEAKKEEERQTELEKIIESRKYTLPINAVKKRRAARTVLIIVAGVLVLVAVAADLALDAGVLHIDGVQAVTHFFH